MVQSKNILFKKEYAKHLFEISKGDLATSSALISAPQPGRVENILYMIQQSGCNLGRNTIREIRNEFNN